ncbi:hypothetical protein D9615_003787 [Tricholomella constricta]|uniref:Transcription factor IIIC putative zinc-finger domain-containing protein n=1 Tax=Tricholomella constricta TaxID=117010 RepID=A0A8H5HHY4_9AGAR|nr:hypothetical protein D9615_003787 [Tricholomella constricta]
MPLTKYIPGEAHLSYAASDGTIGIFKITQSLEDSPNPEKVHPELRLAFGANVRVHEPNNAGVTGLSWVEIPNKGVREFLFTLNPAYSIYGAHLHRRLVGRAIVVSYSIPRNFRLAPQLYTPRPASNTYGASMRFDPSIALASTDSPVTSQSLSNASRSVFIQSEEGAEFSDMNRITGLASYDGSSTFIWIQEASRPSDFSYKHDAKHSSTLLVAGLWDDLNADDALLCELEEVLNGAKTSAGKAPLHLLRPFFFRLRDKAKLSALHPRILEILRPQAEDHSAHVKVAAWPSMTPDLRTVFRTSLVRHLFGWDVLLQLRMRLSLADFAWKHSDSEEQQEECGLVAQSLLTAISHRVLRTIIRHLAAAVNLLTPNDIPFVLRVVVQSLLPGSPADLSAEGHNLQTISQTAVFPDPHQVPVANSFNELCPACRVEVPLQDITTAVCANGHTWGQSAFQLPAPDILKVAYVSSARCSITTFILSTPLVRTCIGCSRKAFLPLSTPNSPSQNWLPDAARGWIVEELLEAVHRCLFCNNSFVSVL